MARGREFWLQYVIDQAGPTASLEGGVATSTADGKLTKAGFVGHRRQIQQEHPLEGDLLSVGLGVLPEYLRRWEAAKVFHATLHSLRPMRCCVYGGLLVQQR